MSAPSPPPRPRGQDLSSFVRREGIRQRPLRDFYAFLLSRPWRVVLPTTALIFFLANGLFALLYWASPGSIEHMGPNFGDAFWFSVQTFGSIGYGYMHPQTVWGHFVVTLEAFVSILCLAMLTGLVFAKISLPRARVIFTHSLCVEPRNGIPTLTFRIANERGMAIADAEARLSALVRYTTAEGSTGARFVDLELEMSRSPMFAVVWQLYHRLDETSPLHGLTPERLMAEDTRFIATINGLDTTFYQAVHARYGYWPEDVRFDERFVDMVERMDDGQVRIDYRRLQVTESAAGGRARALRASQPG
ncbi:MAG: ion channel [Myxococcota bacterium]